MSLHQDIKAQMVEAMKARDSVRLTVLRGLLSSFTNEAVAKKRKPDEELSDEETLSVISRAVKQRKDSIEQFEKGGRKDLSEAEQAELSILEIYLPKQMSRDEIFEYVKSKLESTLTFQSESRPNASGFIGIIMKELKGKADGSIVKEAVDSFLSS